MHHRHTAPTEAYAPDADRAGADAPVPEWIARLLALLIRFMLQHLRAIRLRRCFAQARTGVTEGATGRATLVITSSTAGSGPP